jgi:hypothetical protein
MLVNARMYSVAPAAKAAWRKLLGWILERSALRMQIVDHDPPAALADLWQRPDLGCAMMCGLPYSLRNPRPILIAAPVPSPARYAGRAVYFSDIAVRADAPYRTLEDTFGSVCGYTLSGFDVRLRRVPSPAARLSQGGAPAVVPIGRRQPRQRPRRDPGTC